MKKISGMNAEGEDKSLFSAYCGYCGSKIAQKETGIRPGKRTWKKRIIVHINICQEPSIIYFCNRDCKLNWIFKSPNVKLEASIEENWTEKGTKPNFEMGEIEDNTEELEKYLKENKVKILRQA